VQVDGYPDRWTGHRYIGVHSVAGKQTLRQMDSPQTGRQVVRQVIGIRRDRLHTRDRPVLTDR
jgi:hypothetical protein